MKYLYVALGGAIGTLLRFISSSWIIGIYPDTKFPWGTLFINLSGSLIIGFLAGFNQFGELNINLRLFLFIGILGGFTTYSGYALETLQLIKTQNFALAISYILITTLLGIGLAALGFWMSSFFSWNK